ncbi:MAG: carbohydrate porin [Candidatus Binatus sp.]|uniref:carbohydrate porin n=1 Tax=Candidatus Binatus sp. TaxID=2811406 RepID=UPI002722136E|nr:carbohydrate porin [Candidatus Binatus sp.]MDO8432465.1 carbohydrate porin [Candidatus Binatus sp.]
MVKALSSDAQPISANPGASNIIPGTGLLGHLIGLDRIPGVSVGGLWIGNANYLFTGGVKPRTWSFNGVLLLNLNVDAEKLIGLPGGSLDAELLQFNGENDNGKAGVVTAYDGLSGPKPFVRTELYELWWRQSLFADKFVIRVGKTVPTYDFNNVSRAVPTADASLKIPSVTGLIYTPIFKNPTLIGASPGYYNSAYGITANFAPTKNFYLTYAFYDGALATGVQTGLREDPVFDGHYFTIGEAGYAWKLGAHKLIGVLGAGGWAQTGELLGPGTSQNGAEGFYTFGSQRLWRRHENVDNSGISGFFQFGINDSRTMIANEYFGAGFTGFGLIPDRPADSIGAGLAWSWLNRRYSFRSNEAILQAYYQMHLIGTTFLEPVISYIPNPGESRNTQGAVAITAQLMVLF